MSSVVHEWLPAGAALRDPVPARIAKAVADWSALWFSRRGVTATNFAPIPAGGEDGANDAGWRIYRGAVAIGCSKTAASRLLDWALDASLSQATLNPVDRRLIDAFEQKLLEDLALKLELALGVAGEVRAAPESINNPFGRMGGLAVSLSDDLGGRLLSLAVPIEPILPLCKSSLTPRIRAKAGLDNLAGALGAGAMTIEATLGAAELALSDLRGLAPGDVLVLGTPLSGAAQLGLPGDEHVFAHAKLTDIDGRMALTLQA